MHEWALAEAVTLAAVKVAQDEGLSEITELTLLMGELQQIDQESFEFALDELRKPRAALLGKAKVRYEKEEAAFLCRVCSKAWGFKDVQPGMPGGDAESVHFVPEMAHAFLRCPGCGSPDFEITHGRGVRLSRVSGESRP